MQAVEGLCQPAVAVNRLISHTGLQEGEENEDCPSFAAVVGERNLWSWSSCLTLPDRLWLDSQSFVLQQVPFFQTSILVIPFPIGLLPSRSTEQLLKLFGTSISPRICFRCPLKRWIDVGAEVGSSVESKMAFKKGGGEDWNRVGKYPQWQFPEWLLSSLQCL